MTSPLHRLPEPDLSIGRASALALLRDSLLQWSHGCPGAGFEHHGAQAFATILQTPGMQKLLSYAQVGIDAEARER